MRLLRVGILALVLSVLLAATALGAYGRDQQTIRWFPGTGIAGKLDVWGPEPAQVVIENRSTGAVTYADVLTDGSFVAPLPPGTYRLQIRGDSRSATIRVPAGECVDLIVDYRVPWIVFTIPG